VEAIKVESQREKYGIRVGKRKKERGEIKNINY
jgi:hypothetical protein